MFKGNVQITINQIGGYDGYGQTTLGPESKSLCSIVKLTLDRTRTSVRRDTSGSGGKAHEKTSDTRLLVNPSADISAGCKVTLMGQELIVNEVQKRYDVRGVFHHYQVDCGIWA